MSFNTPRKKLECECVSLECGHHGGPDDTCRREGRHARTDELVLCKSCRENATKAERKKQ